ncbi:pentapeptide repeat-containing protein [Streptomyces lydicus]|uniref:pentapeptide repeat-containing protein n=1 Tax=Streptomyces lydicus TaxID=47763 RepID=UPI0037B36E78
MVAVSLPGLAALAALLFTWMQVGQASKELRISEQGQITSRFNAAITNLGSQSMDLRLGGIYALERIMQDSSRDHPTVVAVLSAYVRQHAPLPASGTRATQATSSGHVASTDVQAVINVLAHRLPGRDRGTTVDLNRTDLRGLKHMHTEESAVNFRDAEFAQADLRGADLGAADLRGATLDGANLTGAYLEQANLAGAGLTEADLTNVTLCTEGPGKMEHTCPNLTGAILELANLTNVGLMRAKLANGDLAGANLTGAILTGADLTKATLDGANLTKADLTGADLTDATLDGANLTKANLTGAHLTGVKLKGAKLDGVRGLPPSLR